MKKITGKILLVLFFAFFITTLIPRVIFKIFKIEDFESFNISNNSIFIAILITVSIALIIFMLLINQILVKRIKALNQATEKVAKGDFDISIPTQGHDEISMLSEHFNKMVEELKSNEYLNKSFASNFSHEFKTPITAIKGYSDLIVDGDLTGIEIQEYASIISNESERLSNLAKNMLQLTILEASPITQQLDSYNVSEQIRSVLKLFNLTWEDKHINVNIELDDLIIVNNEELTYHIWKNLIDNAIKYTPENKKIDIILNKKDHCIDFIITNYGIGITAEQQSHIFEKFYSIKDNQEKGSGIGLAIVKKIVDNLQGEINVSSDGENYVSFQVILSL